MITSDADLIILLRGVLASGMSLRGWSFPVVQRSQPTQQGIPTETTVYFQKMYDNHYGTAGTSTLVNNPSVGKSTEVNTQKMETTFQISVLTILLPSMDVNTQPTASDISNYLATVMQRRDTIRELIKHNVNVLKFKKIGNDYFEDDRHRHEAWPVFEVVLAWEQVTSYVVDNTDKIVGNIYVVPD